MLWQRRIGGAGSIHIGHGHQLRVGNPATQILRVALAHVPDSQHPDTQLTHPLCPLVKSLLCAVGGLDETNCPLHHRQYKRLAKGVQVLARGFLNDCIAFALQVCLRAQ